MEELRRQVTYYETDQMGAVHHSNYIRWFEEARVEFMRGIGLSYRAMEEEGVQVPVVSVSCKYRSPSTFDDVVVDTAYSYKEGKNTVCYIASTPKKDEGNYKVRGDIIGDTYSCMGFIQKNNYFI